MDINNNQQIHTFSKGMNTDTSDMYISNELYRYAENLRYTTNKNSNSGELRLIEGTNAISLPTDVRWDEIVAMTSIRDYLIVIGAKKIDDKDYFNIWRKNLGEDSSDSWRYLLRKQDGSPTWLPLESRNFSLCGRWESDLNVKLYMADGVHPLMCLRMNNFNEVTSIDNIDDLSVQVNYLLPPLSVSISDKAGQLKPAKVQYAYTLSDDSGMETSLSILSNTVSLYNGNKGYGINENAVSDSSINIAITYPPEAAHLTNVRLYRITYRQGGQPPLIELFYDGKRLTHFKDTGSVTIKTLSVEEFLAITKLGIIPQEIESKDQYLFLGNIKYTQDIVDNAVKDIDCTAPSTDVAACYEGNCEWNPAHWYMPNTTPQLFGGKGTYFKWEFVFNDLWVNFDNTVAIPFLSDSDNIDRKSLRRGEIYRYGVILYDKHGRASSPKFVADVMVPPLTQQGFELIQEFNFDSTKNTCKYKLRSVGVKFTLIQQFPESAGISGWLIVRVKRTISDRINITLGIIGSSINTVGVDFDKGEYYDDGNLYSTALLSMQMQLQPVYKKDCGTQNPDGLSNDISIIKGIAFKDQRSVIFMSPEQCYTQSELENILPESEQLKVVNVKNYDINIRKTGLTYIPNGYMIPNVLLTLRYEYTNLSTSGQSPLLLIILSKIKQDYNLSFANYLFEYGVGSTLDTEGEIEAGGLKPLTIDIYEDVDKKDPSKTKVRIVGFSQNHLFPIRNHTTGGSAYPNDNVILQDVSFIDSPESSHFAKSSGTGDDVQIDLTYKDDATIAGYKSFINWTTWGFNFIADDAIKKFLESYTGWTIRTNIASGPKCALLTAKNKLGFGYYLATEGSTNVFPISVVNISRIKANPYGGGLNITINKDVFLERDYVINSNAENVEKIVYDGDCFVGMFTANVAHIWKDALLWDADRVSTIYTVPIESDINLKATRGDIFPRMDAPHSYHQQDKACMIKYPYLTYVQKKDAYLYNTAYSKEEDLIGKSSISYKSTDSNNHDGRIHYSQPKVNGLNPDPWPEFKATNYIDVDTRYGAITGLKLFKDKLFFWQENATGVLTVNEKAITQSNNGSDIILGTSDVMQRYDYLSTVYGMYKYQHAFTESNSALYWWDSYNKELLLYSGLLTPMSKAHGVENYINTTKESTKPHLAYDCDYDEIIANIRKDEAIVYNERGNAFTSIYTFNPKFSATIDGKLYLSNGSSIYKMDSLKTKGESYLFNKKAYPMLKYIVNANSSFVKVFDIQTMGANFYNGDYHYDEPAFGNDNSKLSPLRFKYRTKLNQESEIGGLSVSNREYDYRLDVPRHGSKIHGDSNVYWGDRMRGKTMQCELSSISNSTDFSLQYIITKYRMSWS